MDSETLDEAYQRFRHTGPEWGENQLSNHGPMVVEVLIRRGHIAEVGTWIDHYVDRLDELPSARRRISDGTWREALGDGRRIGDWTAYFERQVADQPWRDVLSTWWPRLLPGIMAGATHGVIRVGHVVRALLAGDRSEPARTELAHGLAFWAARSQAVPGVVPPGGALDPLAALDRVPRIPDQSGPVAHRFGQLADMPDWSKALGALRPPNDPADVLTRLTGLVHAATVHYLHHGQASPVLLVHVATAPNAVRHTLPALPRDMWAPSLTAVWAAAGAIVSTFAPAELADVTMSTVDSTGELLERAVAHGDEHVIKFTDTATESYEHTGDSRTLTAAVRAIRLIGH